MGEDGSRRSRRAGGGSGDGLHTPGPLLDTIEQPRRWTPSKIAAQVIVTLGCLGLLGWAMTVAFSADNRERLEAMRDAPLWMPLALIGLSALGIVLNGTMFWQVLLPIRRLGFLEVIGVNAIATFLSILPFKLGLVVRGMIHHRRDRMSFRDIIAWFAAMSALGAGTLGPVALASLITIKINALWWVIGVGGAVAASIAAVVLGRLSDRSKTLARLSMGSCRIVRHVSAVAWHFVIRTADVAVLVARFAVAAMIAGYALPIDQAILFGTTYFMLSVISPSGTLGWREGIITALAAGIATRGDVDAARDAVALVTLTVTAAETLTSLVMGAAAWIAIRPDRYFTRRTDPPETPESPA